MGKSKALPEKRHTQEAKPPSPKEPVSPINILAFEVLKIKYAPSAPTVQKHSSESPSKLFVARSKHPKKKKKGADTDEASPSNPSVRLTEFTQAKKIKMAKGKTQKPSASSFSRKGIFKKVRSFR